MQMLGGGGRSGAGEGTPPGARTDSASSYAQASQGSQRAPQTGGTGGSSSGGEFDETDDIPFLENDAERDVLGRRFDRRLRSLAR